MDEDSGDIFQYRDTRLGILPLITDRLSMVFMGLGGLRVGYVLVGVLLGWVRWSGMGWDTGLSIQISIWGGPPP